MQMPPRISLHVPADPHDTRDLRIIRVNKDCEKTKVLSVPARFVSPVAKLLRNVLMARTKTFFSRRRYARERSSVLCFRRGSKKARNKGAPVPFFFGLYQLKDMFVCLVVVNTDTDTDESQSKSIGRVAARHFSRLCFS